MNSSIHVYIAKIEHEGDLEIIPIRTARQSRALRLMLEKISAMSGKVKLKLTSSAGKIIKEATFLDGNEISNANR